MHREMINQRGLFPAGKEWCDQPWGDVVDHVCRLADGHDEPCRCPCGAVRMPWGTNR